MSYLKSINVAFCFTDLLGNKMQLKELDFFPK